tara:strand:+ start:11400 stop:13916 length:2517 start_codon:yes stop_codon:yes gene_type:complete
MIKKNKFQKGFALSQIFLLVISIVAISYAFGSEVGIVSSITCPYNVGGGTFTLDFTTVTNLNNCPATYEEAKKIYDSFLPTASTAAAPLPASFAPTVSSTVSSQAAQQIVTFQGQDYLITSGTLSPGNQVSATNLVTGQTGTLTLDSTIINSATSASDLVSLTGGQIIDGYSISTHLTTGVLTDAQTAALAEAGYTDVVVGESFVYQGSEYTIGANNVLTSTKIKTIDVPFLGKLTGVYAHLAEGVIWAGAVYGGIQIIGAVFGLEEETKNILTQSAWAGIATWKGIDIFAPELVKKFDILGSCTKEAALGLGWCSAVGGAAVGVIVFLFLYSEEEEKIVTFSCLPWQAPVGGNTCEECNEQDLPCSEYQCKSLGQACELLNPGTDEEKCVWVNRQDVNPPTIEPWEDALLNDYRYSPDNSISPPDRGVKINYLKANDNCIPAFTPLQLGVILNEPAKCKIDVLRKQNFEEMRTFLSGGLSKYNHTYALSLPGKSALESENITVQNNGNYEMFLRCEDANGNSNTATFVFKYCVDKGPDTTPPLIVTTSILNNVPIAYNKSSVDLEIYVNEPSNCRWSHDNQDYKNMEETMQCSSSIFDYNAQMLYKCSTTLTSLNDRVENKFYFRCEDQPKKLENERNTNTESYEFNLMGTQPLVIDSIEPNDTTISDSTDVVKVTFEVETSAGHKEGESICYYSDTENENNYIKFFETQSFEHKQDLFLTEGNYDYFIKCTDLGGNSDYETINFDVETDTSSPQVVRAYKEENYLKLITDEEAECVYSTFGCSYEFSEGTKITVVDEDNHFTDWNVQSDLYIKCQDNFGNQPLPNQCSITARANDF